MGHDGGATENLHNVIDATGIMTTARLISALHRIALADQRPGHVYYMSKSAMAKFAWDEVVDATGIDPTGAAEKERAAYVESLKRG